jgi:aminoglycoside phosphotransferase (APT) family kinase protein
MDEETVTALSREMGVEPTTVRVSVRRPLEHQSNRLYDLWIEDRHLIVKEYLKPDEREDAAAREFRALELLAPLDIAPRHVWFQPALTASVGPVVVYEFMEGEMWDRRRPSPADLEQLADLWARMNAASPEPAWRSRGFDARSRAARFDASINRYAAWVQASWPEGRPAVELCRATWEARRRALDELSACRPVLCFGRAEARFANVIARPGGRLGLIDWEDSGLRDPAIDVADLLTHPNQEDLLGPADWQAFLRPYYAARSAVDPGLPRRSQLYMLVLSFFWLSGLLDQVVCRAAAGQRPQSMVNGLPIEQRLRRYLARALAWPEIDLTRRMEESAVVRFLPDE